MQQGNCNAAEGQADLHSEGRAMSNLRAIGSYWVNLFTIIQATNN